MADQRLVQAKCFVCVDENGAYQIVSTSKPAKEEELLSLVKHGMEADGVTTKTFHFTINVPVPEHEEVKEL